ncbi:MAG: transglutaminase domain-containing protein [Ginsengibacter sp.]
MKFFIFIPAFLCCSLFSKPQVMNDYAEADRVVLNIPSSKTNSTTDIAAYINSHFDTDRKKVRAAYTWVATNIKYDAAHLHRVILNEDHQERVTWAMERKKGVCENFAAILADICIKFGVRAYFVEGYTRSEGSVDRTGHAWSAINVDGKWLLYDPTWDAGFSENGSFVSHTGARYFQVSPAEFIQSHMPFDPMFQFLDYPLTYEEFSNGFSKAKNNTAYFNYVDSIAEYERLDPLSKYNNATIRIEKNGAATQMVSTKLKQLKMEKEIIYQDIDADLFNSALDDYKAAIADFQTFLNYRNNQFMPAKPIAQTESMLDAILEQIADANNKLKDVNLSKATLALNTGDVEKVLNDLSEKVKEQQIFLRNYLSTAKEK